MGIYGIYKESIRIYGIIQNCAKFRTFEVYGNKIHGKLKKRIFSVYFEDTEFCTIPYVHVFILSVSIPYICIRSVFL
jgi:hypothetical protein